MRVMPTVELVARAVEGIHTGISIADATRPGYPLTYVNGAFEVLTGYTAEESLGRNCRFLQGPDTDPVAVAELRAALAEGRDARVVLLNHRKDGTPFWNELRLSSVRDDSGEVVQVVGVQNDVTELFESRQALEVDRERAVTQLEVFQEVLTPAAIPERPRLEVAGTSTAAEQGVSGDFHLVAPGPGDGTVVVVGDAMGHGLAAARRATFVRATLATFARFTDDPQRLLELANEALIEKTGVSADFVTAVCVTHHPDSGLLCWASAGHPIPLRLGSGAPIGELAQVGTALGITTDIASTRNELRFAPGDGVLLYTDGMSEARPPGGRGAERLGEDRVRELVVAAGDADPSELVEVLRAAAVGHSGGRLADDLCLLALRAI